ncbi:MAG: hypothetical protein AAB403_03645 [Planctomycetota bacterium]
MTKAPPRDPEKTKWEPSRLEGFWEAMAGTKEMVEAVPLWAAVPLCLVWLVLVVIFWPFMWVVWTVMGWPRSKKVEESVMFRPSVEATAQPRENPVVEKKMHPRRETRKAVVKTEPEREIVEEEKIETVTRIHRVKYRE